MKSTGDELVVLVPTGTNTVITQTTGSFALGAVSVCLFLFFFFGWKYNMDPLHERYKC